MVVRWLLDDTPAQEQRSLHVDVEVEALDHDVPWRKLVERIQETVFDRLAAR
ncbi:hypothetical protein D3C71_1539130 [compost metagenome]